MAYDPALTSFIIVGVVGGVAVVMNASSGWEITHELARASDRWTSPYVIRRYRNDSTAQERASKEAAVLQAHGYERVPRPGESRDLGPGGAVATGGRHVMTGTDPGAELVVTYRLA
jgi:hypothetical protein